MSGPPEKIASGENPPCDECGSFGAVEIGDHRLCPDCVVLAGSACAGSADDPDTE
jgi:hypothetical protein